MKIIGGEDRKYLGNNYHVVGQPFDAYNRMAYHGYKYDPSAGLSDEEMDRILAQLSEQIAHLSHQEQKARMVVYVLEHTRIDVNPHDYFIGLYSWNRAPSKYTLNRWYPQLVRDHCAEAAETMRRFEDAGMNYGGLDFDHTVPDWDSLMQLGFRGILERAERFHAKLKAQGEVTEKQEAFYCGVVIEYGGHTGVHRAAGAVRPCAEARQGRDCDAVPASPVRGRAAEHAGHPAADLSVLYDQRERGSLSGSLPRPRLGRDAVFLL